MRENAEVYEGRREEWEERVTEKSQRRKRQLIPKSQMKDGNLSGRSHYHLVDPQEEFEDKDSLYEYYNVY